MLGCAHEQKYHGLHTCVHGVIIVKSMHTVNVTSVRERELHAKMICHFSLIIQK